MTNEGDGTSSTPNVRSDGGKKNKKGKKQQTGNEPNLPGLPPSVLPPSVPTPRKGQTSLPPLIVDGSDVDTDEESVDVTAGPEWIARVEMAMQAVEIIGQRLNRTGRDLKALEEYSLEEVEEVRKELEARQRSEYETKEAITSLEIRFREALGTIESLKAKVATLEEDREVGGSSSHYQEREARVEAPKPPVFIGVRDAQAVDNFLWHLENYFKCMRVRSDVNKINTAVLYLSELAMLWWKRKESDIAKGSCALNTWEKFRVEFKKAFLPSNIVYEAKRKMRELRQKGSIRAYVREFTILTFQIPDLKDDDALFYFMDGLQNWARTELERRQVRTIDDAITQAEALTDFRREKSISAEEDDEVGSHDDSGDDSGEGEEQTPQPKRRDTCESSGKKPGDRGNTVRDSKDGCFICKGPHGYKRCPELKNLGAILRERKEEKAQEEVGETKHLGVVSLCGAVIEQPSSRPRQVEPRQAEPKHVTRDLQSLWRGLKQSTSRSMGNLLVRWSTPVLRSML